MIYYRQCKLANDTRVTYAWIPECWAQVNRTINSRTKDKELDGFVVKEVFPHRRPEDEVIARETDYRHQRGMSDI